MKKYTLRMLAIRQVDKALAAFTPMLALPRPRTGWVFAIRKVLGMSGRQLASRMGIPPGRISRIEKGEVSGSVTLDAMSRAAEAFDCRFIYAFVPNDSLEALISRRAHDASRRRAKYVNQSMKLEGQQLDEDALADLIHAEAMELIAGSSRTLWDESE